MSLPFKENIPEMASELLDSLPFGISIQNRHFEVIYQNKYMDDLVGDYTGSSCFQRWEYLDDWSGSRCIDCPGYVSLQDKEQHKILRKTLDKSGNELYVEITHVPLIEPNGEVNRFVEIMKNVSPEEKLKLELMGDKQRNEEELYFSLISFGDLGGDLLFTDDLPFISSEDPVFFIKMGAFWFAGIGQGHNWESGLFGPLPVLDFNSYQSYSYSFELENPELEDPRFKGKDLILLLIFSPRQNSLVNMMRDDIEALLSNYFSDYTLITDINDRTLPELHQQLSNLIVTKLEYE